MAASVPHQPASIRGWRRETGLRGRRQVSRAVRFPVAESGAPVGSDPQRIVHCKNCVARSLSLEHAGLLGAPAAFEEATQQPRALLGENPRRDLDLMIEAWVADDVVQR